MLEFRLFKDLSKYSTNPSEFRFLFEYVVNSAELSFLPIARRRLEGLLFETLSFISKHLVAVEGLGLALLNYCGQHRGRGDFIGGVQEASNLYVCPKEKLIQEKRRRA